MQALERTIIETNWITLLFVFLFVCIFVLKALNTKRLKGYVLSLVNNSFVETEIEENNKFLNLFQSIIFLVSVLVVSFLVYDFVLIFSLNSVPGFYSFLKVFIVTFSYFLTKRFLEYVFSVLFLIEKQIRFFLVQKASYLYSVSFIFFAVIIVNQYTNLERNFLFYFTLVFFLLQFILIILNNKKLVFSKLFYFILYICAFEIAPLFILFKLML